MYTIYIFSLSPSLPLSAHFSGTCSLLPGSGQQQGTLIPTGNGKNGADPLIPVTKWDVGEKWVKNDWEKGMPQPCFLRALGQKTTRLLQQWETLCIYLHRQYSSSERDEREKKENIVPNSYSHRSTLQNRFRSREGWGAVLSPPKKCWGDTGRCGDKLLQLSSSGVCIQCPTSGEDGESVRAFVHAVWERLWVLRGKARKWACSYCDYLVQCMRGVGTGSFNGDLLRFLK